MARARLITAKDIAATKAKQAELRTAAAVRGAKVAATKAAPKRLQTETNKLKQSSQGSVKTVGQQSNTARANINSIITIATNRAKSGRTAREGAQSINEANAAAKASGTSSAGTVKINSSKVRTPRIAGGLMGGSGGAGGGNWRNMFK